MGRKGSLDNKIKKLKNLPQYRELSDFEVKQIALKNEQRLNVNLEVEDMFINKDEIALAKNLEKKYLENYAIEKEADKTLLKQLIYLEVFHTRLQQAVNKYQSVNETMPLDLMDALHKNLDQILDVKEKMGLNNKKDSNLNDGYKAFELLKKKIKIWLSNNQASRQLKCPYCYKMFLLRIKTEAWEAQKHPFFKDGVFGNEHLIKLYQENKITAEDAAKILEVSPAYIEWLIEKWNKNTSNTNNEVVVVEAKKEDGI